MLDQLRLTSSDARLAALYRLYNSICPDSNPTMESARLYSPELAGNEVPGFI